MKTISFCNRTAVALLAVIPLTTNAADVSSTAQLGYGFSDNVLRASTGEIDSDIITAGLNFLISEETENVFADIDGRVVHYDYASNLFEDETLALFNGQLQLRTDDGRLAWTLEDNYGQQVVNVFEPIRPNNRENVNLFSTGPNVRLPIGQRNVIDLGVRYSDMSYEIRPQDNERHSATLQLIRQMTPNRNFALVLFGEEILYDDQVANIDLDRAQASGRFEVTSARTNLVVDAGWSSIKTQFTESDGLLLDVSFNRQTSPFGNLGLQLGTRFSESGNVFDLFQLTGNRGVGIFGDDATADIENTSDPFRLTYASLSYQVDRGRFDFGTGISWSDEEYENRVDLNREYTSLWANVSRQVSERVRLFMYAQYGKRDFPGRNRFDDDIDFGAGINWTVSRRFSLDLDVSRFDRDSAAADATYDETRVFLTLNYILLEAAAVR